MENMNEKVNLVNSIDDKIHKLLSLKFDYWDHKEINRFYKPDLEDKVKELSSIMNEYANQCGIVILCAAVIIGMVIFGTSFIVSRNVILSLSISIISLCVIWTFMKKYNRKNIGSEKLKCDIKYDELTKVNTVKEHYEFWDSSVPKLIEPLADVSKVNILMRPFTNMFISTTNYVRFKTRYYDNVIRLIDFYEELFYDIWFRNKNACAEEFVEYFVKNTSAWSCRKEIYQLIMFNCTEFTFTGLFLSFKEFDMSKYRDDDDIRLYINDFMRCVRESDKIDELTKIDKILTFVLDVDDYCQKKLDNINSICN